jgi:hypothetical protein
MDRARPQQTAGFSVQVANHPRVRPERQRKELQRNEDELAEREQVAQAAQPHSLERVLRVTGAIDRADALSAHQLDLDYVPVLLAQAEQVPGALHRNR